MTRKIIIAGGSGFLGNVLAKHFHRSLFDVVILSRHPKLYDPYARYLKWDGKTSGDWKVECENAFAVINLTGKSVNCRYNDKNRKEILESRIHATEAVGTVIQQCKIPPKVWINAASTTIYRHSVDRDMDEETGEIGNDFSMNVCKEWEKCFYSIQTPPVRKVVIRTALVLGDGKNSVLPVMKRLVRSGLGGKMGRGDQFISWIHQEDFARAVEFILVNEKLCGTINVVAPHLVTNNDFMRSLRNELHAPFGIGATTWMLEIGALLIGTETELILKSRRAVPKKLPGEGFQFRFPKLQEALHDLLRK